MLCAHLDTVPLTDSIEVELRRRRLHATGARRSSAPTTRRRSRCCWRSRAGTPRAARRSAASSCSRPARRTGCAERKAFDRARARGRLRLRLRPRLADRRADPGGADLLPGDRRVQRPSAHAGHPAGGGPQRDRRGGQGDRGDAARPARRGDDRERRPDRGRHRDQRRAGALPRRGGGAQPRRRQGDGAASARWSTRSRGRRAAPRPTSTPRSRSSFAPTACPTPIPACRWPPRRCATAASSRSTRATGGGSDANAFEAKGFRCLNIANGTEANHTPDERVSVQALETMLDVTHAPARARGGGLASAEAAARARSSRSSSRRAGRRGSPFELDDEQASASAIAYPGLTGPVEAGDEVVVNVEAQDLGLGSGGFDIVCVNLTRGLGGEGAEGAHVMKLNYTPLQHAVVPVEEGLERLRPSARHAGRRARPARPARARGFAARTRGAGCAHRLRADRGRRASGRSSRTSSRSCSSARLLADHVTVAPCFGGEHEAITVEGALHAARERLGWDAALVGPGPGHPRLGLGARPRRARGAAQRSLRAGARLPGHAGAAPLERRPARATPRAQPPHARRCSSCCCGRSRSPLAERDRTPSPRRARASAVDAGGHRLVEVDVDELVAPYLESGLPASDDGPFVRAGRGLLPSGARGGRGAGTKGGGEETMSFERDRRRGGVAGPDRHRASRPLPARRRRGRRRGRSIAAPGRRRDAAVRRRADLARAPAARGRRRAGRLLELPAGKLDAEARSRSTLAKRELREEIGKSAATWESLHQLLRQPRLHERGIHAFLATDL